MFHFSFRGIDFAHKLDDKKKPSENYEKHLHHFYEIVFFMKGKVRYVVEQESKRLAPNDLVFINSGRSHFAEVDDEERYERYVLKFEKASLPPYLQDKVGSIKTFHKATPLLTNVFKRLDTIYGLYNDEEAYILYSAELTTLLVLLLHDESEIEGEYNEQIAKIVEWIDSHIEEPISLERIASTFHYSPSQISNAFKKYAKMPIMKTIKMKKLIAARNDIRNGEKKNEVALRYSFENYSTFYRLYTKAFHESPSGKNK